MSAFNKWMVPQPGDEVEGIGAIAKVIAWWPDFKSWEVRTVERVSAHGEIVTVNGPYRIGDGPDFWRTIASR